MIALDTNLLVYAHRSAVPEHEAARAAIGTARRSGRGWGFALFSIAELWSVVTHPAAAGRPSEPAEVAAYLRALVEAGARIWAPGPDFAARLLQMAEDLDVSGPRLFDLQIGLAAFDAGATEVWTHDQAFVAIPGLRVGDPP